MDIDIAREFREKHSAFVEQCLKRHFDKFPHHLNYQLQRVISGNVCEYKVDGLTILKVTGPTLDGTFLGYKYEGFKYD